MASRTARKGISRYKIRNWKQYEAGLIQRGSISFWINDDAIDQWNPEAKDKTRGRQEEYSDLAIQICLTFRLLYRQALRQTEGFINSLLKLMDLDLICPDHTTLSRRSQTLKELQEQLKKVQKKGVVAQRYFGIGSPIFLAFYLILTESDIPNLLI